MRYENVATATFVARPNRFIAEVLIHGRAETVHVKNTGRCRELLLPGAVVSLALSDNPNRKTRFDLIAVEREGQWINIDSQAPNAVAAEYLRGVYPPPARIHPEVRQGDSRLDFCVETGAGRTFVEVKGVTLLVGDTALFPDAPTARGTKHLHTLTACAENGDGAMALFIVQMKRARRLLPNKDTDPAFAAALRQAGERGVALRAVDCLVTADSIVADRPVPVEPD